MTVTIVLSILALISAALTIYGRLGDDNRLVYPFKPLTMGFIILIAVLGRDPVSDTYRLLIVLGLLASLGGDVLLMLPDRFRAGLFSFLVAHLLYIAAFSQAADDTASLLYAIPFVLYAVVILWRLWRHVGAEMRPPVLLYTAVITLMAWEAANRWLTSDGTGSELYALIGAYLFLASDTLLAFERFRGGWRLSALWVLGLYFPAQWLIALSV